MTANRHLLTCIVVIALTCAGLGCSWDHFRRGVYEGIAADQCRQREGENYPRVEPCPAGRFEDYDEARKEHLEEVRREGRPEAPAAERDGEDPS